MGGSGRGEGSGKGQWAPDQQALSAPSITQRTPSGHNLVTADEALFYLGQWSTQKTREQRQTQGNLLIEATRARKLLLPSEADTEDALTDALHENTSKGLKHRVNHWRSSDNFPGLARTKSRSHSPVRTEAAVNAGSEGQSSSLRSHSSLSRVADSSRPYSLLPRSSSTSARKPSPSRTRKLWCTAKPIKVSSGNRFYSEVIRQQGRCPKRTLPVEDGEALCVPTGLARVSSSTMSIRWTRTQSLDMNTAFTCTSVSYAVSGDDRRVNTMFTRTKTAPG